MQMMPRGSRSRFSALLAAGTLLITTPALAAAPSAHERSEAKSRFDRAIRLFEDGSYESALLEFRTSMDGYPTRVAAFNIAVCLRKLARFDEEEDALALVAARFPTARRSEQDELKRARQEAADRIATLVVTVSEPGAIVGVDGRQRGTSPLAALRVSAGPRTITVRKAGFRPFDVRLDLPARVERTLTVTLEAEATASPIVAAPAPVASGASGASVASHAAPLWPVFALGGAGVVAGGVGALFLGLRAGTLADGKSTCHPGLDASTFARCQSLQSRAKTQAIAGGALLGSGGALIVAAGLYAVLRRPGHESATASVQCAPSWGGLSCSGTF